MSRPLSLLYIIFARIPSERATGIQVMKMCEAFSRAGLQVELVVPRIVRRKLEPEEFDDVWSYYSISHPFKITRLPVLELRFYHIAEIIRLIIFTLQSFSFSLIGSLYVIFKKSDFVITRSYPLLCTMVLFRFAHRRRLIYEVHSLPVRGQGFYALILRFVDGLVVLNSRARRDLCRMGIPEDKVLVAPDGFDPDLFLGIKDKEEARVEEGIPEGKKLVVYTGHLYEWKGVYTLVKSMRHMGKDCILYLVGGFPNHVRKMRRFVEEEGLSNVVVRGHVAPEQVRNFLAASDVVILPNSAKSFNSRYYTSPLKLFEYMAAERPIVASRLPSLEEILTDGETALLVEPNNPEKLAQAIMKVLEDEELAESLAKNARQQVTDYTWDNRARRIVEFMISHIAGK